MEEIIASGRSVLVNGRIVTHVAHLPSAAQLAGSNPESAEAERLLAQQAETGAELQRLAEAEEAAKQKQGQDAAAARKRELRDTKREDLDKIATAAGLPLDGNADEVRARILAAEFPD